MHPEPREVLCLPTRTRSFPSHTQRNTETLTYQSEDILTDDEISIRDTARQHCQSKLFPRVINAARNEGAEVKAASAFPRVLVF